MVKLFLSLIRHQAVLALLSLGFDLGYHNHPFLGNFGWLFSVFSFLQVESLVVKHLRRCPNERCRIEEVFNKDQFSFLTLRKLVVLLSYPVESVAE